MTPQPQPQPQDHCTNKNKNRLQDFTSRAKLPYPVYQTLSEGPPHLCKFRSTVVVDGKTFTSSQAFGSRKAAEQDVAKIALEGIHQNIKDCISSKTTDGSFPPIYQDKVFCKSILHEFVQKMNLKQPTYNTVRQEGVIPIFVSSLDFNGVTYIGEPSTWKKEAEQLAARALILSILGSDGENIGVEGGTILSTIIKSKTDVLFALHKHSCTNVDNSASSLGFNSNGGVADSEGVPIDTENTSVEAFQGLSPASGAPSHSISLPESSCTLLGLAPGRKRRCKRTKKLLNDADADAVAGCNVPHEQVI